MKIQAHDVLFSVQLACAVAFVWAQTERMLYTMQGISPTWMACAEAFCLLSIALAWRGWRAQPSRATLQLLIAHGAWTLGIGWLAVLTVWHVSAIDWDWYDTVTFALVLTAAMMTVANAYGSGRGVGDPLVRGALAAIFRGVPHLTLACKIGLLGGTGLAGVTVLVAHVSALTRIGQLVFAVRAAGWDRARRGLAIAEAASEGTWILVTIVWLSR